MAKKPVTRWLAIEESENGPWWNLWLYLGRNGTKILLNDYCRKNDAIRGGKRYQAYLDCSLEYQAN